MLRWYKLYAKEWLDGSIRMDLNPDERSVWTDLIAMATESRRPGFIERAPGKAFTIEQLAIRFCVPVETVKSTIMKCLEEGRLTRGEGGTLIITNWNKYQTAKEPLLPETQEEKRLREIRELQRLSRKYPDSAITKHTETIINRDGDAVERKQKTEQVISHEKS